MGRAGADFKASQGSDRFQTETVPGSRLWIKAGVMQTCANATTVAFTGLEARRIEVQVQMTGGQPGIVIVGLGDKAVSESRERVRAAFASIGLAIPAGRLVVNLAPADLPKEGTH